MNAIARMPSVMPSSAGPIGFGPGGPLPVPSQWISYGTFLLWSGGVVVGNPSGGGMGPGTINASAFFTNGVAFDLANYLPLTGGTIGGNLTINGNTVFGGPIDGVSIDMGTF